MATYEIESQLTRRWTCDGGGNLNNAQEGIGSFGAGSTSGDRRTPGKINGDQCSQEFFEWDTSVIPGDEIVVSATIRLRVALGGAGDDYTMQFYVFNHGGASSTSADFRSATWLQSQSAVAATDTTGWPGFGGAFTFDLDPSAVNVGGLTRLVAASSHQVLEQNPSGSHHYREFEEGGFQQILTVETVPAEFEVAPAITTTRILSGRVPQYQEGASFILLDQDLEEIGVLHPFADEVAEIELNVNNRVKRQLRGLVLQKSDAEQIDVIRHRLLVNWTYQTGDVYPLGVFHWSDLARRLHTGGDRYSVDTLLDQTVQLDQRSLTSYSVPPGGSVREALLDTAAQAGIPFTQIDDTDARARKPLFWPPGHNLRDRAVQLGRLAGFVLYFDNRGIWRARPPGDLETIEPEITYGGLGRGIIRHSIAETTDTADAPSDYLVISNGGDSPVVGHYPIPDDAPHSSRNRRYHVVEVLELTGIASAEQAVARAKQAASTDVKGYRWIEFEALPDPRHDLHDVVGWFDAVTRAQGGTWRLKAGAHWTHQLREVYR